MKQEAEEAKELKHKSEIDEMSHNIMSLKKKLDDYQKRDIMSREDSEKLAKLFDMEIIDEYGDLIKRPADDMS